MIYSLLAGGLALATTGLARSERNTKQSVREKPIPQYSLKNVSQNSIHKFLFSEELFLDRSKNS
jgi:hypothetical protein